MTATPPRDRLLVALPDGTVKQRNPFTGTEVWTVPGRGDRPLVVPRPAPRPLDPADDGRHCAFCAHRVLETPPERSRLVVDDDGAARVERGLGAVRAAAEPYELRRVPNLFEILGYDYWRLNHGWVLPVDARARRDAYLADPAGRDHVRTVLAAKRRAAGQDPDAVAALSDAQLAEAASGFFAGGHDVVIARRHFVDGAEDDHALAGSGTLTPAEHRRLIAFTAASARDLYAANEHVRYVSVFQNWLRPAGASFDHLHKQLVAIDEVGAQNEAFLAAVRADPAVVEHVAVGEARRQGLVLAENDHAVLFAGFGHRYPTLEVWSTARTCEPWDQEDAERDAVADLVHAAHAATGPEVPVNEEWHTRPAGIVERVPWRVMLKWRVSTLAGFEGATKINVNTVSPWGLRDRVATRLRELEAAGALADGIRLRAGAGR